MLQVAMIILIGLRMHDDRIIDARFLHGAQQMLGRRAALEPIGLPKTE